MSILNCPACASEQTQRLSAIVESGTSHTRGTSVGGFSGIGGMGGGVGGFGGVSRSVTNSVTKSTLANKLSAPVRKQVIGLYLVGALLILFGFEAFHLALLLGLLMLAGGGWLIYTGVKNAAYNREQYPGLYSRWSDSFYCHRCQTVYLPAGFAQAAGGPIIDAGNRDNLPEGGVRDRLQ